MEAISFFPLPKQSRARMVLVQRQPIRRSCLRSTPHLRVDLFGIVLDDPVNARGLPAQMFQFAHVKRWELVNSSHALSGISEIEIQ